MFLEHLTWVDWLNPHASHELLPRRAGNYGPEALPQRSGSRVEGLRATGGVKVILSKLSSRVVVAHTSVGQPLVWRLPDHSLRNMGQHDCQILSHSQLISVFD